MVGRWDIETVADVLIATLKQPSRVRHHPHGSCLIVGDPGRPMSSSSFWAESARKTQGRRADGGSGEPDVPWTTQ